MAKSKAPAAAAAQNGNGDDKPIRNLYLVDGSGYLFRAYHALPPMTRPDGTPINAVLRLLPHAGGRPSRQARGRPYRR